MHALLQVLKLASMSNIVIKNYFLQVLLDDFSCCRGYKFLHDYLLYLERKSSDEIKEVLRNVVLLIQSLVMAGFLTLEPTTTDGGPFQDPGFQVPAPLDPSK